MKSVFLAEPGLARTEGRVGPVVLRASRFLACNEFLLNFAEYPCFRIFIYVMADLLSLHLMSRNDGGTLAPLRKNGGFLRVRIRN